MLIAIVLALIVRAEDRSGEWINLTEPLAVDTPSVKDTSYTGTTPLHDVNMLRYDYAYKVDSVFANDSIIIWWQVCNSLDFSTTPVTSVWYDTITDMTTSWQWTGTYRELKSDSLTWGGYLRAMTIYFVPDSDTLIIGNEYNYEIKTDVFLDIDK